MSTHDEPIVPPGKRRWHQFSLRTLLVVMLLASVGLSWFAVKLQQARRQRAAVEAILEAGGHAIYEWELETCPRPEPHVFIWLQRLLGKDFFASVVQVHSGSAADDETFRAMAAGMPHLRVLSITGKEFTQAGLAHVGTLTELETLLFHGNATDEGLARLAGLKRLTFLDLQSSPVSDSGLMHLEGMMRLEDLNLACTKVNGDGLEHLAVLTNLELLDLSGSHVREESLWHLQRLPRLRQLEVFGTEVSDEGMQNLQQALPRCEIHW